MLVQAYGAHAGDKPLEPMQINRRTPAAHDVQIDIAFCGICHSDLHQVRAEWAGTQFPCVPGHEIVGRVSAVGVHVAEFKVGDLVGVGCVVDSSNTVTTVTQAWKTTATRWLAPTTSRLFGALAGHRLSPSLVLGATTLRAIKDSSND
jgi:D-arabinose 1-dehydrogenase-like Zn-dependent alcohol dehydrogenase